MSLGFIDLFCGCGGFTLGMLRAGHRCLAAIDLDPIAVETLKQNLSAPPRTDLPPVTTVLQRDLATFAPEDLEAHIGRRDIDVIVGGPPCQGFSTARQVDGANNGKRLKDDPRRHLYKHFLRFVDHFQPRVFVIENVLGIRTAEGGKYFTAIQKEARELGRSSGKAGYRVHSQIESAEELGVPQKRRRQLIIGVRADIPGFFPSELQPAHPRLRGVTLWDAIGDLPPLKAGGGEDIAMYDHARRKKQVVRREAREYRRGVLEVQLCAELANHVARPHSERDLRDFLLLGEGESSAVAMRRGVEFEFPYDKTSFKDRYTRQHRNRPCSTIVAHLSKDGLMFIHPTQNRSLTPREAARIQSFPDWFRFPSARTHAFRLIGNAVPPLIAHAVGLELAEFLATTSDVGDAIHLSLEPLPRTAAEAVAWLAPLLDLDPPALRRVPDDEFKRAWFAIAFLYAGLHPDSACDHGKTIRSDMPPFPGSDFYDQRLLNPYYEQSGWPVILAPLAAEAGRRFESDRLHDREFYCLDAQMAGLEHRRAHPPFRLQG